MFPGMNQRKAQAMMKKMGISQQPIDAEQVIIKCPDKEIIINSPEVSKVNMMGQQTFQIVGEIEEKPLSTEPEINEEDVNVVMEQTNSSREAAEKAIKDNNGDLAQAILSLKEE